VIDHDRLFKELLTTFFLEFVELFAPDMRRYLEPESITFLDKELFLDLTSGERREVDLIVRAQFRGKATFFLIHVENQSHAQADFGQRMFRYFTRLHEKFSLPVYPIALFSYDSPQRQEPDTYRVEFPDRVVLTFTYHVIQLNRLNWRDFVRQPNPLASALMAKMAIAPKDRPHVKYECLRLLATLRLDPARMRLISAFIDTYLRLNPQEEQLFQSELGSSESPEREAIMELTTSWKEQGIAQGRQEGRQEGELVIIMRLLARRIGAISPEIQARVQELPVSQLEALSEALLDFTSAQDLEEWLRQDEQ
jgi:predicted transposase YdaD